MSKQDQPPPALHDENLDRMGHTLLTLAKHVWTLHDRQRVLEAQLTNAGIAIDTDSQPDEALSKALESEREKFIDDLLQSLAGDHDD